MNYSIPSLWLNDMWIILFHLYGWKTCELFYSISMTEWYVNYYIQFHMIEEHVNYSIPSLWLDKVWIILFDLSGWKTCELFYSISMAGKHVNYSIPSLWLNDMWIFIFNLIWLKNMWIILFHLYGWRKCELFYSIFMAKEHVNYSIPVLWLKSMRSILILQLVKQPVFSFS